MISFSICGSTLRPLPIPFKLLSIDNTRRRDFLQKYFPGTNGFRLLRVIGVMKPFRKTPGMYPCRVSLGSMAASTAMVCVLSLAPNPVSLDGGFLDPPLAHAQCCLTAQTQIPFIRSSEYPITMVRPGDLAMGRDDGIGRAGGVLPIPRGQRMPRDDNQQAPFFTTDRPLLTSGGWRMLDRAEIPRLAVVELTAGTMLVTASAELGETAGLQKLAPAVIFAHSQRGDGYSSAPAGENPAAAGEATQTAQGNQATDGAPAVDDTRTAADQSVPADDADGETGEFSGSPAPAGPDLTTSEEQDAIARGWK